MGDNENEMRARDRIVMASELLNGSIEVSESQAHDLMKQLGQLNQTCLLYKFDEMPSEGSLTSHIEQYVKDGSKMGPWVASTLLTCTDAVLRLYNFADLGAAREFM